MWLLILAMLLWWLSHSLKVLAPGLRAKLSFNGHQGVFALGIVLSVVLMVIGWRLTPPVQWFDPVLPALAVSALSWLGVVSLSSSGQAVLWNRFWHHPQLYGVAILSLAHMLGSGTQRGVLLFGGLGLWAVVCVLGLYRRDGAPSLPAGKWGESVATVIKGSIATVVLVLVHQWISGVALIQW